MLNGVYILFGLIDLFEHRLPSLAGAVEDCSVLCLLPYDFAFLQHFGLIMNLYSHRLHLHSCAGAIQDFSVAIEVEPRYAGGCAHNLPGRNQQ